MNNYSFVYEYASLADALNNTPVDFSTEFKKTFPGQNVDDWSKQNRELRDVLWVELWERVSGTE